MHILISRSWAVLFMLISIQLMAQDAEITGQLQNRQARQAFPVLPASGKATEAALPAIAGYEHCDLVLKRVTESHLGKHYLYQQVYRGIPVYGSLIKVNTTLSGHLLSAFHSLTDVNHYTVSVPAPTGANACWVVRENELVPALLVQDGYDLVLQHPQGDVLYRQDQRLFFTDTMVRAMVFNPDPITTAGVTYGKDGTYRNFNDSDYTLLNDQRQLKSFPATFRNDTFFLANKYCIIKEKEAPVYAPSTSTTGDFFFTRSKIGFKEVMAMYHIYALQQYVQQLGFNNLVNYQLNVDPHASTADQSFFSYSDGDTVLKFGLGGVPDAEDADVIVHEYTHAISFSLNSDGITSIERRALEEGICDAVSCIYSKKLSTYNWRNIFGWDGHNEFWDGRNGSSAKTYDDKIGDNYSDSEIWSSAMNNLTETIGEDAVIRLLFSIIPQFTPFTTMPQAAHLMYDADSLLFQKANQGYLALEFNARRFDSFPVGLENLALDKNFRIENTFLFANGSGNARIRIKDGGTFVAEVFDMSGRSLNAQQAINTMELDPKEFTPGIYLVRIRYEGREGYLKLVRY